MVCTLSRVSHKKKAWKNKMLDFIPLLGKFCSSNAIFLRLITVLKLGIEE